MRRVRGLVVPVLFSAATVMSCSLPLTVGGNDSNASGSSTVEPATDLAFTDDALVDKVPETSLEGEDPTLTRFEAEWLCELQRRTFTTPTAIDTALEAKLADSGLGRSQYDAFRGRVNVEQDLRNAVLFAYQETCQP